MVGAMAKNTTSTAARRIHGVARARIKPPEHVYPVDEWNIVEKWPYSRFLAQTETIFSVSNGYLGLRGDHEEGGPAVHGGAFVNGFYESWPIVYGEAAYGFAETGQTIVNVTDGKIIRLYVDDEPFELLRANIVEFSRVLNMREGTLDREIHWETPAGKRISIKSRRFVSLVHRHLALVDYEVRVLNADAHLVLASELANRTLEGPVEGDPRRNAGFDGRVLERVSSLGDGLRVVFGHRTRSSGLRMSCGMDHQVETSGDYTSTLETSASGGRIVFSVVVQPGESFRLTKFLAYHSSSDAPMEELCARAGRTLNRNLEIGREELFAEHARRVEDFWRRSDVQIEGDPGAQQAIRFNLFQLLQATSRVEGYGVPAKGLTGQGYEGHYFWDAEIYVLPFLIYTAPRIARSLLRFRYGMLDRARARAKELGHRGALFPWRTINGDEASAYYAAGTAQYHIDADIAYALKQYVDVTDDLSLLYDGGAEIMVETARLWADLGCFSAELDGAFAIHGVTGPDEYTAIVNNNRYTNMMARENLRAAVWAVDFVQTVQPETFARLVDDTGLDLSELEAWTRAAERMYLPVDEKTGINPQDDTFLAKEVWPFHETSQQHPLLLHFHPLVLYRHQVLKQADVVMAMFLLGHDFSLEEKKRNFDYYDPLTTRDSSLSSCIQSIVAMEIGYEDTALDYFLDAALMDLTDVGGNVIDGVHVASAGGVWMALVYGFGGLREQGARTSLRPRLPPGWTRLCFPIAVHGQTLEVDVRPGAVTYTLREGESLTIRHDGEDLKLERGHPVQRPTVPPPGAALP